MSLLKRISYVAAILVVIGASLVLGFMLGTIRCENTQQIIQVEPVSRWIVVRGISSTDHVQTVHYSLYYNMNPDNIVGHDVISETNDYSDAMNFANRQAYFELEKYRAGEISLPDGISQVIVDGTNGQVGYYQP